MRVIFTTDVERGSQRYRQGANYNLDPSVAAPFIAQGVAYAASSDGPTPQPAVVGTQAQMLANTALAAVHGARFRPTDVGLGVTEWFFDGTDWRPLAPIVCVGTPLNVISAPVGSLAVRTDGGASTTLYVKESGAAGNAGWVAK